MKEFDYGKYCAWQLDGELLSLIAEIHEQKGRQNYFVRQKPEALDALTDIAKIQSVEASNAIEGIVTTAARLSKLLKKNDEPKSRDEEEILGYRDVLNTIHESYEYIDLTPNIILQLHRDLLRFTSVRYAGKYKLAENIIGQKQLDGSISVLFRPLSSFEVESAMSSLCGQVVDALYIKNLEPLIVIPVFIYDFLCIHPFSDGNGRMSRLLTALLLYKSGFSVGKYISIERLINHTKQDYYAALQKSSVGWHDNAENPMSFIKYMLKIIVAAYKDFESRVIAVSEAKLSKAEQVKKIIIDNVGKITKAQIIELLPGISEATIKSTLASLIKSGEIKKVGSGKNSGYTH